jgi:subtilase family serine protease
MPSRLTRRGTLLAVGLAASVGAGLLGSNMAQAETAEFIAPADAGASADFDVFLPLRNTDALTQLLTDQQTAGSPQYHVWLTPAQFRDRFGADDATVQRLTALLAAAGMTVTERFAQGVHVHATVAAVDAAFATTLATGHFAGYGNELLARTPLMLPAEFEALGAVIPAFHPMTHLHKHLRFAAATPDSEIGPTGPYFTSDLRQAYDYPALPTTTTAGLSGAGVTVGILMSGAYNPPDIAAYFTMQGLATPSLTTVPINGGAPYSANNSAETHLDIMESGGMAPGVAEILYNVASLTDANLETGLRTILQNNAVDLVNMSYGEPEIAFEAKYDFGENRLPIAKTYDNLFIQGNTQGITFVASSGDSGSDPTVELVEHKLSTEHPAVDPHVTGVGGTNLVTISNGTSDSAYVSENADDDPVTGGGVWGSGGGISVLFAKPSYQTLVTTGSTTKRTVPDIALHMGGCPSDAKQPCGPDRSADYIVLSGQLVGVVGTSCSSPDIVGLLALKVALARGTQASPAGRLGDANPMIYALAQTQNAGGAAAFHHGITGTNGAYKAGAPYNEVLGNGTVDGRVFLGVTNLPASGDPGTQGNP